MINIFDVASTFLSFDSMSHKKLQKLCYYAQAWFLAINERPLFNERIEAWVHGPVSPELYQRYKNYGSRRIPQIDVVPYNIHDNEYIYGFINTIYKTYGDLSANELESLTHSEMPWINARGNLSCWDASYDEISYEDMINYYSNLE